MTKEQSAEMWRCFLDNAWCIQRGRDVNEAAMHVEYLLMLTLYNEKARSIFAKQLHL